MRLQAFRTHKDAKLPTKAYPSDTCYDLFIPEDALIGAYPVAYDTGIRMIIPPGFWIRFMEKSGKALKGLQIHGGVIDSSYTGNLKVIARVDSNGEPIRLKAGEAICQFSIEQIVEADLKEITEEQFLAEEALKARKGNGFGSTGR